MTVTLYGVPGDNRIYAGKKPKDGVALKSDRPSIDYVVTADGEWELSTSSIVAADKKAVKTELKSGVKFKSVDYPCDEEDIDHLQRGLTLLSLTKAYTIIVKDVDGNKHELSDVEYTNLCKAAFTKYWSTVNA